jgi:hypothetical protein
VVKLGQTNGFGQYMGHGTSTRNCIVGVAWADGSWMGPNSIAPFRNLKRTL